MGKFESFFKKKKRMYFLSCEFQLTTASVIEIRIFISYYAGVSTPYRKLHRSLQETTASC